MAISVPTIKQSVLDLLNSTEKLTPVEAKEAFSEGLANIIQEAIISATVTVEPGIAVATSGGVGSTTGPGTGTLS